MAERAHVRSPMRALVPLVAIALLSRLTAAHFNLRDPAPYNPIDCNRPNCNTPCPPIWLTGSARATNSPENPARSWARGDEIDIEWHRNNHEGGFYRRSLVPVKYMHSHYWHNRMAFEWGCWAQNIWECGTDPTCGTDKNGFAYRNRMTVPHVFPDGDYVFAMAWYGGLHWRRQRGFFTDYRTCAFVRIEGGEYAAKYEPKFVAGTSHYGPRKVPPGKCVSASSYLGECKGLGCRWKKPYQGLPWIFMGGRKPPTLYLRDFNRSVVPNRATRADLQFGTMKEELAAIIEQTKEYRVDNRLVLEERQNRIRAERSRRRPNADSNLKGREGGGNQEAGQQGGSNQKSGQQGGGNQKSGQQGGGNQNSGQQGGGNQNSGQQGSGNQNSGQQGGGNQKSGEQVGGAKGGQQSGAKPKLQQQGAAEPKRQQQGDGQANGQQQGGSRNPRWQPQGGVEPNYGPRAAAQPNPRPQPVF